MNKQETRGLKFSYKMELAFSDKVQNHRFTLRMLPQSDERQRITQCVLRVEPECKLEEDYDSFGNKYMHGEIVKPHERFQVELSGQAQVEKAAVAATAPVMALAPYRFPSQYTRAGDALRRYYEDNKRGQCESRLGYAERLLHQLYQDMEYVQGVTDIHTTAEEAAVMRKGVCQDYAHIMLSLCRIADIPSRYVVGMMAGEGYSHAWVEVCVEGAWYGLDPTNDRVVDDGYIKISHGRDYQDCIVNRGVFNGFVTQTQNISVSVQDSK